MKRHTGFVLLLGLDVLGRGAELPEGGMLGHYSDWQLQ
jgi:hypothetical protein